MGYSLTCLVCKSSISGMLQSWKRCMVEICLLNTSWTLFFSYFSFCGMSWMFWKGTERVLKQRGSTRDKLLVIVSSVANKDSRFKWLNEETNKNTFLATRYNSCCLRSYMPTFFNVLFVPTDNNTHKLHQNKQFQAN